LPMSKKESAAKTNAVRILERAGIFYELRKIASHRAARGAPPEVGSSGAARVHLQGRCRGDSEHAGLRQWYIEFTMATQPRHFLTSDEYLDLERPAEFRSEYVDGEMFAMAGASPIHDAIVKNVSDFFTNRKLRSCSCLAFTSNMKIYLRDDCVFCYPDLTICCGEPAFHDGNQDVLLNPTAVFEVLSPSTKSYDLGDKSFYYRRNPSLRHLILIWSDRL